MVMLLMSLTDVPVFATSCASARLWSRRVIAEKRASARRVRFIAIRALVLAGLPVTHDPNVVGGAVVDRLALRLKIAPFGLEQVAALHPLARGRAPTSRAG